MKIPVGIPVIDIAPLLEGDSDKVRDVAGSIGDACRQIGFFHITGHGIPSETVSRIFQMSAAFFAAPDVIKQSVGFTGIGSNRGYVRDRGEALDRRQPAEVKEAFNIGLELAPNDPELLAKKSFRAANMWPNIPGFRTTMLDYFDRMWGLGRTLHHAFSIDLGLEATFFDEHFRKPMAKLRLLHYPPSTKPLEEGPLGAGVHTDYGHVTVLATDAVGGLMIRDRNGRWLYAPVVPGAFICNVGDCLMRWTNDIYVSTPHKVLTPPGRDHFCVAYCFNPDPGAAIRCLPTCATQDRPARYPAVTYVDFLKARLEPT
ncbi:2-oxoglutarate and iron-dependent oxygenase domain-containing protein [Bradyrhizobium sp. SSUT18]|uniref:isopenicillin N synthase family dioxygenase n=1 Tax=Bradyrhizobium sp. SSUT18 TaxID=3040602 RepID=UPI0024492018|nr:2-oxoglutarate and iron-dependent oxygenase domain-containing protein [Bradyrhizobium sp. SSUT18]MDH2404650.1 2-oxoglutarate and iron-dependent oxygenase domain-containing protein [Bradyrhizobium sp. SSUT18]